MSETRKRATGKTPVREEKAGSARAKQRTAPDGSSGRGEYGTRGEEQPTRKNFNLYQSKIDLAKEILGTGTETETIDQALGLVIFGEQLARGTRRARGRPFNDVFGEENADGLPPAEGWVAKFVVDTNLYIDAIRTDRGNDALAGWQRRMGPHLFQHSVVAQEVLAGATDEDGFRGYYEDWVRPFERLGRVVTPTHEAWKRSALILSRLVAGGHRSPGGFTRSFLNDCLIAASAREEGFTLVTRNREDYATIARVEPGFQYVPPWP